MSNTSSATGRPGAAVEPRPERLVVRATRAVDHDELPVEDRGSRGDPDREAAELREPGREVEPGRVHEPDVAGAGPLGRADEREDPVAAPGGLEQVVGRVERVGARDRPHRRDGARCRERRIEPEGELLGGHRGSMVARPSRGITGIDWPDRPRPRSGRRHPGRSPGPTTRSRATPEEPVPRPARPDDLYRLAVPSDPRLSPDGSRVVFTVKRSAVGKDGYRQAIWSAPVDGSEPARQLTLGVRSDRRAADLARTARRSRSSATAGCTPRRSPTGRRTRRSATTASRCSCCRSTAGRRGASRTCRRA